MKSNYYISVLIAVVLCYGQLASNAHILSHLSMPLPAGDHAELGHQHHTQTGFHTEAQTGDEPDSENLDCGIYHTFAGSTVLTTVQSDDIAVLFECVVVAAIPSLVLPARFSDNPHIRGPPQLS